MMRFSSLAAVFLSLAAGSVVSATPLVYEYSAEYTGAAAPQGAAPWLRATIDEDVVHGVTMVLEAANLVGDEFVSKWGFNLDPSLDLSKLTVQPIGMTGSLAVSGIAVGANAQNVPQARLDLLLSFATSNAGGGSQRFGPGESITFALGGIDGLSPSHLLFEPATGSGLWSVAHVQGIADTQGNAGLSGWVRPDGTTTTFIPEPASLSLLALGSLALLRRRGR